jgi:hypothetical protein
MSGNLIHKLTAEVENPAKKQDKLTTLAAELVQRELEHV